MLDAILHGVVVSRFGLTDKANVPFLVFGVIDAILAVAVFLAWPYAIWAALILTILGIVGLTVTFSKPQREKSIDRAIWVVDAAIVLCAAYLLFFAAAPVAAA